LFWFWVVVVLVGGFWAVVWCVERFYLLLLWLF